MGVVLLKCTKILAESGDQWLNYAPGLGKEEKERNLA